MLPDGKTVGYIGEHNATILEITPPDYMLSDGVSLFCLAVETGREFIKVVVRSAMVPKADKINIPLWRQATGSQKAKLQIEAYDDGGNLVIKSPVAEVEFLPSVNGVQNVSETNNTNIIADIAANTSARHTHANIETLNKLGDSNGSLTYNGKAVGGLVLHSKYYSNDLTNGVVDVGLGSYDAFLEVFEPLPDNAIIYNIGIWYEKTDGEAKEYKDIELYTSELISSVGSFEIFGNPIFDSDYLQGYGVGRINDTGLGILLNSIKSNNGKTKGFTVYYYEA